MKKYGLILATTSLLLILTAATVEAQTRALSTEEAARSLLTKYKLNSIQGLSCDSLDEEDLELLGEAWIKNQQSRSMNEPDSLEMMVPGMMGLGMMQGFSNSSMMGGWLSIFWLIGFSIYILFIILLLVLIRYFWKKGGEITNEVR